MFKFDRQHFILMSFSPNNWPNTICMVCVYVCVECWFPGFYLLRKFSKNAMLFFKIPGTNTGLDGRSGDWRPVPLSPVEFLQ